MLNTAKTAHFLREIALLKALVLEVLAVESTGQAPAYSRIEVLVANNFLFEAEIVGIASNNLEDLTRLPKGSGEQNMLNFVPHVSILELVQNTNVDAKPEFVTKLKDKVTAAYQNQLKYKHADGGFSDFQDSSSKPSTFLTAQVAMSLKTAAKYITVDGAVVDKAFQWLAGIQQSDGSFEEVGDVYNQAMQGRRNTKKVSLTAFVLIAFLESSDIKTKHAAVIEKASDYLVGKFSSTQDKYDLAVATYALSMQNHKDTKKFHDKFVESSQLGTDGRFWDADELSVEITAYGLLSYLVQGLYADATSVMHWLNKQREAAGAFSNIQDTFIGLKALAKTAGHMSSKNYDYHVKVRVTNYYKKDESLNDNRREEKTFSVDRHNLHAFSHVLPNAARALSIEISGQGYGFFQIHYQYAMNVLKQKESKKRFIIDVRVNNSTSTVHNYDIEVCIAYKPKEKYVDSDKTMVEVFFPSGLAADKDTVRDLSKSIMNIENRFGDTSLVIYYQSLGEIPRCFQVTAHRRFKVANHRPAYVMAYSVNNKNDFGIQEYAGPQMGICDICEDEDCKKLGCMP